MTEKVDRNSIALRLFVLLAGLLTVHCADVQEPGGGEPTSVAIGVRRVAVTERELAVPIFGTGTIAAHKTTEVGPRVDGIIDEIYVKVGDRVEAGAPLFRTRPVHYQIRVDEAFQSLRLAKAELANATRERDRITSLHESRVASEDQLDDVNTGHDLASARVGQAEAAHARALQDLEDTTVRAPYAGAITHRYVDEGAMVRTMMSANSPVVRIMKMDIVAAIVQIPELHLPQVRVGTPARLHVDGVDRVIPSEVYILNDLVDPVSRAFEVRLPIANDDLEIKPGLFVQAECIPEPRHVVMIERGSVLGTEGNRYVFLEKEGKASRHPIQARDLDATRLEVLDGLSAGAFVLGGPNLRRLTDGTPIVVETDHADR